MLPNFQRHPIRIPEPKYLQGGATLFDRAPRLA